MIHWNPAACENLAAPDRVEALLLRAAAVAPQNAAPHAKLGNLYLDGFDFARAASAFETALRLDPTLESVRLRLAVSQNALARHAEALETLGDCPGAVASYERARALAALGRDPEPEYRAALRIDPFHRRACMNLAALLRRSGRLQELLALCSALSALGVGHAQLLLDWGRALALTGDRAGAKRLLFDPVNVARVFPPQEDAAAFNLALAEELLSNPFARNEFPLEEANRGSSRIHNLLSGRRPDLVRRMIATVQEAVDRHLAALPPGGQDPWREAQPVAAHLRPWGLIQRRTDYEEWHTHRGGWLSGVYYVRVPASVSAEGAGGGCIEFGPPPSLAEAMPGFIAPWRHAPREGELLLAPAHYHHRTVPSGLDEHRISFAFDVVPDPVPG